MNEQNAVGLVNAPFIVERTETDMNGPLAGSDPLADAVLVEAAPIGETPMGTTMTSEAPIGETPMGTTMTNEAPIGETPMGTTMTSEAPIGETPMGDTITSEASTGTDAGSSAALLSREESEHFRTRWNEIQGKFVDEPRSAVEQADALVSEAVGKITQMFANEHSSLETQWKQSNEVSTEDLRKTLKRYRSFFNRLVV